VAPLKKEPLPDDLQTKLNALAKLRQPTADPRLLDSFGVSSLTSASANAPEGEIATYSIRDFVRAQVERRWSLNLQALGARNFVIPIHVVMTRSGVITEADIVDKQRYAVDLVYRDIALSARNAVLLSSPISLPAGNYAETLDMTLSLNPRDTLR
jgi:hypothetical protein